MYKIIMAPTDGTGFDREAIRVATQIANRTGAELKLVRVESQPAVLTGPDTAAYFGEALALEREWELSQLAELAAECRDETRGSVTTSLEKGPVVDALARFAVQHEVSLIVISSHGRGGFARAALGSVTDALIRQTNLPVLVVQPPSSYLNPHVQRSFKQILVPLDGSKLAEEILPHVVELALTNNASVTLLNVLLPRTYSQAEIEDSQFPWWEDDVEIARTYLTERAEDLRRAGIPTSFELAIGDNVAVEIIRANSRLRAELIAIATRGRGGLARLIHGSVTDKVMRTARSSMLIFHPEAPVVLDAVHASAGRETLLSPAY
jgi:Universal stress protein UspA and related nucleotide-binding proteins